MFYSLPKGVQTALRNEFLQQRRKQFDELHAEIVLAFLAEYAAEFEKFENNLWTNEFSVDEAAWDEYLRNIGAE